MKGISEIATLALYTGITVGSVAVVLSTAVPALEDQQDASQIRDAQDFMREPGLFHSRSRFRGTR